MTTTPQQIAAISAQLSVDLATVTDDRIIELCLLYRSEPDAYPVFADNLKIEITRRFTAAEIAANDVMFSVIQNFSNQFTSPIPYFAKKMLEMAASVNRDIWFIDNLVMMQTFAGDLDAMNWLVEPKQADVLAKVLNNTYGLKVIGNSLIASTAVLTHQPSVDIWKTVPFLWDAGFWADCPAGMSVIFKSRELLEYVFMTNTAIHRVTGNISNATYIANNITLLNKTLISPLAKAAFIANNTVFQQVRQIIFDTLKVNWIKKVTYANNSYSSGSSAIPEVTSAIANPLGFVFARLGIGGSSTNPAWGSSLLHSDGSLAGVALNILTYSSTTRIDAISFNGAKAQSNYNGVVYVELWSPT